jgi:polyhydroxyalkanoate synthase subunit PhaC
MNDRAKWAPPAAAMASQIDVAVAPAERGEDKPAMNGFRSADRLASATLARMTFGLSPAALGLALADWAIHLSAAPGRQTELATEAWRQANRFMNDMMLSAIDQNTPCCIEPLPSDHRFHSDAWRRSPYRSWLQAFLLAQQWWQKATSDVPGVSPHHEDVVSFTARQWLDVLSPANAPWGNPEIAERTIQSGGQNLLAGVSNWLEDVSRMLSRQPPIGSERFQVGRDVAATPGKVAYRNHLIEIIQYAPMTTNVVAEPVLIVPAWIMKYYILDLSPRNSLIRFLVEKGHTVFCISWRNVGAQDRGLSLEDYRRLGVMDALDAVGAIVPGRKIHAVGYCLGGTLLALAAAEMAEKADDRLASISLLAAQIDFTEPGEMQLFIDDSEVDFLDNIMWLQGYLDASQMAGAFQLLRSQDLIWSHIVRDYLMGERAPMIDLMAWNADATRLPFRMHSEYLRKFFLHNDLASGRYRVEDESVAIQNIRAPLLVVGTENDHVAPWRSIYKIHYLTETDVTFVLTSGGHNAGIVSEPNHPNRHFRIRRKAAADRCLSAEEWLASAPTKEGSWWPTWEGWLVGHSSPTPIAPPPFGAPGSDPGDEVLTGVATVIAPAEKLSVPRIAIPEVALRQHDRYERLVQEARLLSPLITAVIHPCSAEAIRATIEARDEGLLSPILVGPEAKIRAVAEAAGASLAGLRIIPTEHSHAAAARAVELAGRGEVDALMKEACTQTNY